MPTINDCSYLQASLADSFIRTDTAVHASMNKVRLRLLLNIYIHKPKCLDITLRQTHRSFTLTVDDRSYVSHKDKQHENHKLRLHLKKSFQLS
jgi:hypothetical protein